MKVKVLATTRMEPQVLASEYQYNVFTSGNVKHADALAEAAGRLCYKSFHRPNQTTATNSAYLENILRQQHYSVLEHSSVTFLVQGVSRSLLAELTRHRHLSFSVVSQRYVDYGETSPVIPPSIEGDEECEAIVLSAYRNSLEDYETLVALLTLQGLKRKQAREAARAVLPNAAPVDMLVTGNLRAWRDVLGKRHHVAADAEIQLFAHRVLLHLRDIAPASVQDIPEYPYGDDKMPKWDVTINLKYIWNDTSLTFEEQLSKIVEKIKTSEWRAITPYPDTFDELIENLSKSEDTDEFNAWWDEVYDLADEDRVWIATR